MCVNITNWVWGYECYNWVLVCITIWGYEFFCLSVMSFAESRCKLLLSYNKTINNTIKYYWFDCAYTERELERAHPSSSSMNRSPGRLSNQSLSDLHERESERHTYTAATEVVSVASPLFSRDTARCCRAVAAPRVRPLGARAREIQITLIPQ